MDLNQEGKRATELLKGKQVRKVFFSRPNDVMVEFTDGTRLYVDCKSEALELSIVDGPEAEG